MPRVNRDGLNIRMHHCTECNIVWERVFDLDFRKMVVERYRGFPTYGLNKKICKQCKENKCHEIANTTTLKEVG